MPAKKNDVPEEKPILGRVKNTLKMGIVGLPNVGKSLFFSVITKLQVDSQNFPFCTIDPNESQCIVPDARFDYLVEQFKPKSEVPAVLKITDIAGLVKGAAEGAGLGNAFLSHIAAVDGIFHMLRVFPDEDVVHVETTVDPVRDLDIITGELRSKDIQTMERTLSGISIAKRNQDKELNALCLMHEKFLEHLQQGHDIRAGDWNAKEIDALNDLYLLTAKPVIYLINMSVKDYARRKNKWLGKIKAWIDEHGGDPIIPFSATFEQQLIEQPDDAAREKLCADSGCQSALAKIITTGYHRLNLIHFLTCGPDEVRCWTVRKGAKAPQAAGVIHTDFERGFICADVVNYDDFKECGSEANAKKAGKMKSEGRNYVMRDGDIVHFKFNAGAGLKSKKK
eukprot:CAMPEP_0168590420 /NCGR_PEP_ID=MMETSP0420-20121227/6558_1 /TAXON_ID=498008 /ORGANISM="Pessonella sp." /LENGTH=394 /DNA_ID=CAMNT_0008626077 /DNA_START=43 /DNA_END=1230 /DNA_ORIENTATION=+